MTNLFDLQLLVDRFQTNIDFYKDTKTHIMNILAELNILIGF